MEIDGWLNNLAKSVVRINVSVRDKEGNGTGLVFNEDGEILTCAHVVKPDGLEADYIKAYDSQGNYLGLPETVRLDELHDVAVLRIKELKGKCEWVNYDEVKIPSDCYTLGFPLGLRHLTFVKGSVSAKGANLVKELPFNIIEIEGRVNRGNSGGPVIDASSGKVIGLVTMKYIPFLTSIDELRKFVRSLPTMQPGGVGIDGISFGAFFNYVKDGFNIVSDALMMVQVGLAWVIPTDTLRMHIGDY